MYLTQIVEKPGGVLNSVLPGNLIYRFLPEPSFCRWSMAMLDFRRSRVLSMETSSSRALKNSIEQAVHVLAVKKRQWVSFVFLQCRRYPALGGQIVRSFIRKHGSISPANFSNSTPPLSNYPPLNWPI